MVRSITPYDLSFPQNGVVNAPLVICWILNGHICATGHPIHFMFGSRVGFSGSENRMVLFPFRSNPSWWPWHDMTWHDKKEDIGKSWAMSPFILATAILDFWRMSSRRHTIGLPELAPLKFWPRKHGDSRWNFVVSPMSLCSRSWDMPGVKFFLLLSCRKTSQKTVAETRVLQYANFHTVCS